MIIQTAPAGTPRLAIMMYEHMALCRQFANAFGNDEFEPLAPLDPMIFVISNHDAGWAEFDRDPATDVTTGLPYNLNDTPADYITVTSKRSPDFNEQQHPFCGLISSMHSWGLYNGRYGLSKLVPIDNIPPDKRPLADRMLAGELDRQKRLKDVIAKDAQLAVRLDDRRLFQNYKQLQFLDTLALYFNRIHRAERRQQTFENVPRNAQQDIAVAIEPKADGIYALSPFPFAPTQAEFAFAGRRLTPQDRDPESGWRDVLRTKPTEWERFRLVPGSDRL
jgi:hypothetical protein